MQVWPREKSREKQGRNGESTLPHSAASGKLSKAFGEHSGWSNVLKSPVSPGNKPALESLPHTVIGWEQPTGITSDQTSDGYVSTADGLMSSYLPALEGLRGTLSWPPHSPRRTRTHSWHRPIKSHPRGREGPGLHRDLAIQSRGSKGEGSSKWKKGRSGDEEATRVFTHRDQTCCQGGEGMGEGWTRRLGLVDPNYYIQDR